MFSKLILLLALAVSTKLVVSENILFISPVASPSHHIWNRQLSNGLVEKGHNITILTHDSEKSPPPKNYTALLIEGFYEELYQSFDFAEMVSNKPMFPLLTMYEFFDYQRITTDYDLKSDTLKTLMKYPRNFFDLIIIDATLGQSLYPLIDYFGRPPVVVVTPFLLPAFLSVPMSNHLFPSYMPHYMTTFNNRMTIYQRFVNLLYHSFEYLYRTHITMSYETKAAREFFGAENVRTIAEYERNFTLLLANTDPILDYSVPLPPNIIPVGGLHARPGKKLPADLQKIMDEAPKGVILFSLGTNMKSSYLKAELREKILKALEKLEQIVIWKFEEDIEGLPKNVIVRKWLPQNDMMAHPNMKAFISHGGALSTQEAMYHGIPVIGMPCFADQENNILRMQSRNLAKLVVISEITTENMYSAIHEVVTNPMYKSNMQRISNILKDAPMTPLDRAVFWVEHVMKYGFIPEYRLPIEDMCLTQVFNLDIFFIIAVLAFVVYKIVLCKVKKLCKCATKTDKAKADTKPTKKKTKKA